MSGVSCPDDGYVTLDREDSECVWRGDELLGYRTACGGRRIKEVPSEFCPWCGEVVVVLPS